MLGIGINMVAVRLAEPNPAGLVTSLFACEGGIVARSAWRGSRYMGGYSHNYESQVTQCSADGRTSTVRI
jgi:hypothetical protein